jgi:hypothetical protein
MPDTVSFVQEDISLLPSMVSDSPYIPSSLTKEGISAFPHEPELNAIPAHSFGPLLEKYLATLPFVSVFYSVSCGHTEIRYCPFSTQSVIINYIN